jgi:hypothetical protein
MVQLAKRSWLSTGIRRTSCVIVCFGLLLTQIPLMSRHFRPAKRHAPARAKGAEVGIIYGQSVSD